MGGRIVLSILGGLTVDELVEPGSLRPQLVGEALAVIYAGLVARATSTATGARGGGERHRRSARTGGSVR